MTKNIYVNLGQTKIDIDKNLQKSKDASPTKNLQELNLYLKYGRKTLNIGLENL